MDIIKIKTPKGEREIGPGRPVFVIAEMSGNHNGDINRAYKIIEAAAEAGVDAIKLQTYTPDTITIDSDNEYFQVKVNDAWKGQTLYSLYQKTYTPWDWQPKLKKYAEEKGLILFSSPFDETAVDFLETMDIPIYKVASFETVHLPLLKKIGETKKPVIMARGLASVEETEEAINTLKKAGAPAVAVLHCVSSYPAKPEEMNLSTIPDMAKRFGVVAGLSDHSLGISASVAAVALGANIIEKHLTLNRADGGSDAAFSLEPEEMRDLVISIREAEKAIGRPNYEIGEKEKENIIFRPSVWVVKDIKKGEILNEENIKVRRPGNGLPPKDLEKALGRKAVKDMEKGTPLRWDMIV